MTDTQTKLKCWTEQLVETPITQATRSAELDKISGKSGKGFRYQARRAYNRLFNGIDTGY